MTFKHTKFEDSSTMRSLIKVASEKGWIKNNPLEKYASVEREDLTPTNSLTQNVIKLCSGLRSQGMDKFADELENKFVVYKQAAGGIYDVSGEKGEDLVDAAHPDGGHKLEGVPGDSLVETILEKHLKMVEVVDKKPHGKLTTASDILGAVKMVLGQAAPTTIDKAIRSLQFNAKAVLDAYNKVSSLTRTGSDLPQELFEQCKTVTESNLDFDLLNSIYAKVSGIRTVLKPGILGAVNSLLNIGITSADWEQIEIPLNGVQNAVHILQEFLKNPPAPEAVKNPLTDLLQQVNSLKSKVKSWMSIGSIIKQPAAKQWIATEWSTLDDIAKRYSAVPADQQANLVSSLKKEIDAELNDINAFEKNWIVG